ncbi:hypothetical protein OCOJLMKI_3093 [Methylobacterium iners]|uniref:Uncharacterized protein n=1 Tax=Methylobacterium iners TaxID=418707 RepID=A0ABQ4S271_9HYPH|nr:hypothetical protein OCOJLMKI_3093 [Methylobacterium iners]
MTEQTLGKAARLRRLRRSRDLTIRATGLVNGRPGLVVGSEPELHLPAYKLTANELIRMARAARTQNT